MLSAALRIPELRLSEPEAKGLAMAMQNVARHYPAVQTTQQTLDWIALIVCLATVYGTRATAYKARTRAEKLREVRGSGPVVTQFPGGPTGSA